MKRIFVLILAFIMLIAPLGSIAAESNGLISQGSKGEAVVRIQKRLCDLGYYNYKPTGSYQAVTRQAVVKYQVQNELMSDGTIAKESLDFLFSNAVKRPTFAPIVPLNYSAPSGTAMHKGKGMDWYDVKALLNTETVYTLTNCFNGQTAKVYFVDGAYHAEMRPADNADTKLINGWVGDSNSYYKCAVTITIGDKEIAASIQWGLDHLCVYFQNSRSHVSGLVDVEHESLVKIASDGSL